MEMTETPATDPEIEDGESVDIPDNGQPEPELDMEQLWALLDALVPEDETVVRDVSGTSYTLPSVLPARRQVKVLRVLKQLWDLQVDNAKDIKAIFSGGGIAAAFDLFDDPQVFDALDEAFTLAFPEIVKEGVAPTDQFPLEEIVTALVPFAISLIRRIGAGMRPVATTMAKAPAP